MQQIRELNEELRKTPTYADVCCRMLPYADVCGRMQEIRELNEELRKTLSEHATELRAVEEQLAVASEGHAQVLFVPLYQ
jgi:predicted nuclease with TOPRIM domain